MSRDLVRNIVAILNLAKLQVVARQRGVAHHYELFTKHPGLLDPSNLQIDADCVI
jgi:hypothetical protein